MIAAALIVLPSLAGAAPPDSTAAPAGRANSLRAGAWALQFSINGQLLSVREFSGGVSLKRQFSSKNAIRLGVGASGSTQDESVEYIYSPASEGKTDGYSLYLESVFQRYVNPAAPANFYWGLGPYVDYRHSSHDQSVDSTSVSYDEASLGVGARGLIGVEWFASREISLHAEYTATGGYYRTEETTERSKIGQPTSSTKRENHGWSLGASGVVRFGLSVYF